MPASFLTSSPPVFPLKGWAQNSIHPCIPVFFVIKAKLNLHQEKGHRKRREYFLCLDEKRNTKSFCCASAHTWAAIDILWVKHTQWSPRKSKFSRYLLFSWANKHVTRHMNQLEAFVEGACPHFKTNMQFVRLWKINHTSQLHRDMVVKKREEEKGREGEAISQSWKRVISAEINTQARTCGDCRKSNLSGSQSFTGNIYKRYGWWVPYLVHVGVKVGPILKVDLHCWVHGAG